MVTFVYSAGNSCILLLSPILSSSIYVFWLLYETILVVWLYGTLLAI